MYINQVETGNIIKKKMVENGCNVMDICKELNITPPAVYKWINGVCLPSVDSLIVLSKMFNCRMEDILSIEVN